VFGFFRRKKRSNEQRFEDMLHDPEMAMAALVRANPQLCETTDAITGAPGEFGLAVTNPVPVAGIPAEREYLGRLRTPAGAAVQWQREGSTEVPEVAYPVDIYQVYDYAGQPLTRIYISPYHLRTSRRAPEGFICVDEGAS